MMKIGLELMHIWKPRICAVRLMKIVGKLLFPKGKNHFGSRSSEVSKGHGRISSYAPCGRMFSFIEKKKKNKFSLFIFKSHAALVYHISAQTEEGHKSMNMCGSHLCVPFFLKQIRTCSVNGTSLFKKLFLAFPFGL